MEGNYVQAMKPMLDFFQRHPSVPVPMGEPYADYWKRWTRTFKDLCDWAVKNPTDILAVFTHARNLVTTMHVLADKPIGPVSYDNCPLPGSVVRIDIDGDKIKFKVVHGGIKKEPTKGNN
jgi:broad specificity phosphatase PhoE